MKSAVETLSPTRVKMTVEVPFEELKPSVDAAFKEIGSQINVPGFRRGKVPSRIIEQRVGRGAVLQEAVNQALPDFYGQALAANELRPLGQPEVDITEVPIADEDQLVFTAELDVRPEITLPDFAELAVSVDAVDDAAVDEAAGQQMEELRQRYGTLVGVERAAAHGDFVTIDLTGTIGEEEIDAVQGISYEIGAGNMIEGLDEALTGLVAGESKSFTAPLAGGDRAGEDAEINVTLSAVKVRELPDLDDDFAQEASELETFEELQADVRERARRGKSVEQGVQARDKVLEQLLETLDIPVPESIVEAEVNNHLSGEDRLEDDEHRAEVDEQTRRALRTQLLLDAIAEKEEVEVSQQELIEYLVMTAQQYGMDPSTFAKAMDDGDQVGAMAGDVARSKALAGVLERVTVTDTDGNPVDLKEVVEVDQGDLAVQDAEFDDDEFDDEDLDDDIEDNDLEDDGAGDGAEADVVEAQVVSATEVPVSQATDTKDASDEK